MRPIFWNLKLIQYTKFVWRKRGSRIWCKQILLWWQKFVGDIRQNFGCIEVQSLKVGKFCLLKNKSYTKTFSLQKTWELFFYTDKSKLSGRRVSQFWAEVFFLKKKLFNVLQPNFLLNRADDITLSV